MRFQISPFQVTYILVIRDCQLEHQCKWLKFFLYVLFYIKYFAKFTTPFEEVVNSKSNAAQVFVRCVRVYSLHEKLWKKRKKLIWWGSENSHHSSLVRLRFELLVLTLNRRLNGNYSLGNFQGNLIYAIKQEVEKSLMTDLTLS